MVAISALFFHPLKENFARLHIIDLIPKIFTFQGRLCDLQNIQISIYILFQVKYTLKDQCVSLNLINQNLTTCCK